MNEMIEHTVTTELLQKITADQAWHYTIVPKTSKGSVLELYIDETKKQDFIKHELEMLLGGDVHLFPISAAETHKLLAKYYRKTNKRKDHASFISGNSDDFLVQLIAEAHGTGSSDIHIETFEDKCRIRLRIDGKLTEKYIINKNDYPAIVNKIKIKSNLDIAEKRLPQDGRIFFNHNGKKFDIRVSVLPTLHGEKIVMRLLSKDSTDIDIEKLGFDEKQLSDYLEAIKKTHGIVLISGPTGSGKTTTLYGTLKILNKEDTNLLTIEDPIEYTLDGINQVQLNEGIGLTFASALRTFLRQDPDVIMLGEIRDGETAQMAIRASLTGHLVFSTIHTNSAWGTISRLTDMGVPSYLLANTIILTVSQRLIRILCPHCKKEVPFTPEIFPNRFKTDKKIQNYFQAVGCEECYFTGYKGRKAVYEIIPIDGELSDAIKNNRYDIHELLKARNIKKLSDSALMYFEQGVTSIEEIYPILVNEL
jgi:type IV pilus assembly protein PilB